MANSEYVLSAGTFGFCPTAVVAAGLPMQGTQTNVVISNLSTSFPDPIRVGMGAMINDEIVAVQSVSGTALVVSRGCADTIPKAHLPGSRIWFFEDSIGSVPTEYSASASVAIKPLARTSSAVVPIESAPPMGVNFNFRFARPYPPGALLANGLPWHSAGLILNAATPLQLAWAHRNRITQDDLLIPHETSSITPEVDTVYQIEVYRSLNDALVANYQTASDNFTYTNDQARTDLQNFIGTTGLYILLRSFRNGLSSRDTYRIDFSTVTSTDDGLFFNKAKNSQYVALRSIGVS